MSAPDPSWRIQWGARLEKFSHDVFDAFRWMMSVGIARFIAMKTGDGLFMAVSHGLSVVLFLFLMAVFLMRGEIVLFRGAGRGATFGNLILNAMVCLGAFAACLWLTYSLVDVFVAYQES